MDNQGEIIAKLDAILAELTANKELTKNKDEQFETVIPIEGKKDEEVITDKEKEEASKIVENATSEKSSGGEEVTEEETDEIIEYLDL
jgi:hypothetical protein